MTQFLKVTVPTTWGTIAELLGALWRGPFWWLVPLVLVLLPAALLLVVLQTAPAVAPFVYTLF